MKKTNKIILASAIVAVLLLGIGYAAIQNITLNIAGTAAADPSQANFKVMFSGTPTVSDNTYVTAAITDDTNATVNVEGLTKKGDIVTATYTVQNASTDLSADLGISTTNDNTEFFTLSSELAQTSLVAGEATTLTVTVELTKTPIKESVSTTIGVQLEAMPVQPGEEGTSDGINGSSQTPNGTNKYGFYYDKFYANQDEGLGYIAHEDGSLEMFQYILAEEVTGLASDEWICINYVPSGEIDFDEMIADGVTASKEGKIINMNGMEYELTDIENHGIYFGSEYTAAIDDTVSYEMIIEKDGSVKLTVYENGVIAEEEEEPNAFAPVANNYMMLMSNDIALVLNVTGEKLYWYDMEMEFSLTGSKCEYLTEVIKEPSYVNGECVDGEMKYTCPVCGDSYIGPIPAIHTDEDVDGICDNCGESIPYIDFTLDSKNAYMIGYNEKTSDLYIPATFYNEYQDTYYKITAIGSYTFQSDKNLKSVTFAENSQVSSIGSNTFEDCTSLTSVNIPDGITDMDSTFYGCTSLAIAPKIPNGVINMHNTFFCCEALTSAPEIPNSVTNMTWTFYGCTALTSAPKIPNGVTNMEGAFSYCTSLTRAPEIPNSVTRLYYTFSYCKLLTSAPEFPDSITDMQGTFWECFALTDVPELPSCVKNLDSTFHSCRALTNAPKIPDGVTTMNATFEGCTALTSAPEIPNSVTDMRATFSVCTSLTSAPEIPNSVTNMVYTFNNCRALTNAPEIPNSVTNMFGTFFGCTALQGEVTINANNVSDYEKCFGDVDMSKITLTGEAPKEILNLLGSTGNNYTPIP